MKEVEEVINAIDDSCKAIDSFKVIPLPEEGTKIYIAHARMDGKEYMISILPTGLDNA